MTKLRVLDLFSGIGGFSLGLERTGGFETVAFCEIEPYPRAVLKKHWPEVPCYEDVRTLTADTLRRDGIAVDVICGGFPCQDISAAGQQAGMDGTRSGLWSEITRLVGELRPRHVIVENVAGLLSGPAEQPGGWFGRVLGDLAALGYDAEWNCIPANAVGAPHRRDRIWIVAYPNEKHGRSVQRADDEPRHHSALSGARHNSVAQELANAESQRLADGGQPRKPQGANAFDWGMALAGSQRRCSAQWSFEPELGRVAHGVPNRVERIAALGNAVVPQIPELIGRAILKAEGLTP